MAVWEKASQAEKQPSVGSGPGAQEGQEGAEQGEERARRGSKGKTVDEQGSGRLAKAGSTAQPPRMWLLLRVGKNQEETRVGMGHGQ